MILYNIILSYRLARVAAYLRAATTKDSSKQIKLGLHHVLIKRLVTVHISCKPGDMNP